MTPQEHGRMDDYAKFQTAQDDFSRAYRATVERDQSRDPVLDLILAAQALHDECAEYGRVNNLGGYDNHNMRRIRAAIDHAWRAPHLAKFPVKQ